MEEKEMRLYERLLRKSLKNSGSSYILKLLFQRQYNHCKAGHARLIKNYLVVVKHDR